jgi:DNA-binding transcriptional MerR regulator
MSALTLIEIIVVTVAAVMGLGGLVAVIWSVGKMKGLDATVELLKSGNEALRSELTDAARRHTQQITRLEHEQREERRICDERISRLEAQNAALITGVAEQLADAIAGRIEAVLDNIADRLAGRKEPPTS